jgi:hypothetical protein
MSFELLKQLQAEQALHFNVFQDAAMLFGQAWAKTATHEERVERINETYRSWWQKKGGEGAHPMEYPGEQKPGVER